MTTLNGNSKVRKSLAEQIDRLDGILDGLSEGLNESVAAAVQPAVAAAVREAVQGTLTELVTNPDVLALFRVAGDPSPWPAAGPGKGLPGRAWESVKARVQQVVRACIACLRLARQGVQIAWRLRTRVLAVLLGVAAALAAYGSWPRLCEVGRWGGRVAASAVPAGIAPRRPAWTTPRW